MATNKKKQAISDEEREKRRQNSLKNLKNINEENSRLTHEERVEKARKAGKKSAEVRRNNRFMMDMARRILEMPVGESYENIKRVMERFGIPEGEMNYANAMLAVIAVKGLSGDINAAKYVRDSAGYDPMTVLKDEQFEYMKENGQNINITMDGELTTRSRVQIYLPEIEKIGDE